MGKWDARKVLDRYIHDYMKKKNMHETAKIFAQEANVDDRAAVDIDAPGGFLADWWSLFWDVYSSMPEHSSQAVAATVNVLQNFPPVMPRPPLSMSRQTIGNMQPMSQRAMAALQAPSPLLTWPEMNQQTMSALPKPKPETFANFPTCLGFGMQRDWEMQTISSKMYEQKYLKQSAKGLAADFPLLDVDKMTQMVPSSSKSSHQPQEILQNIQKQQISGENQMQQISEKFQQHLERDDRRAINLKVSKAAVPIAGRAHLDRDDRRVRNRKASKAAVPNAGRARRAKRHKRGVADTGPSKNSNASSSSSC